MTRTGEGRTREPLIGVLGGMGPEATLDFYRYILSLTPAAVDQDHIAVLIYSNPKIPDRTQAIISGGESPLPYLIEGARLLEEDGAGIIAMPCNAAHYYLEDMRREVRIPILDMVEETCAALRRRLPEVRTAGLLATIGTLKGRVYDEALEKVGVAAAIPDEAVCWMVQDAIDQVKAGKYGPSTRETFEYAGRRLLDAGAQAVILACTEIPLSFDENAVDYPTLNPARILAQAAVDWALGKKGRLP
jgi:aspartate racemase